MKIFVYATTLTGFTSSIPMRGLLLKLIKIRSEDRFILYFNQNDMNIVFLQKFYGELKKLKNIELVYENFSKRMINLRALIGIKNYININVEADLYISLGTLDTFGQYKTPLINILADLSRLREPKYTSVPWHGKYIMKTMLENSVELASRIICISKFTRDDLLDLYPRTKEKVQIIYNGIGEEWFDDQTEKLDVEGITNDPIGYWIWYGYLSKRKNILNLLMAYKDLTIQSENTTIPKFLIVGKLATNQAVIKEYVIKNLPGLVKIIPYQDIYKLKYLVKKSRGLLFPSFYEGFGLPVIEAFSQGVPVLHSDTSAMPEIAGGLGIPCNPYSIASIEKGLKELLNVKNDIEEINGRIKWSKQFTYKNAAEKFSMVIDKVTA